MTNKQKILAIKGMNDILPALGEPTPQSSDHWEWLEERVRRVMARFAYRNIRTPVVESTHLFERGLGEVTDIVEKEMYSFSDRMNGDALTLRPENTAGVVRAAIEHSLLYDAPRRLYYMGPMFRHERPQRGRYRQFHQIGAEALGFAGPEIDAEVILLVDALWRDLGLEQGKHYRLALGSLGQPSERVVHRAALIAYFEEHMALLDEDAKRRLHRNPLRILDTKNPVMQDVVAHAPKLMDYLGEASRAHLQRVCDILEANKVSYTIDPRLVRGMDYYNLTVFEFVTPLLGAQATLCGGGRYDDLMAQMGGKPAPAVGWALGVERVLEVLGQLGIMGPQMCSDAYAVIPSSAAAVLPQVMAFLHALRLRGVAIQMQASQREPNAPGALDAPGTPAGVLHSMPSIKSQFKKADASGARFALVFGERELADNCVGVKLLRASQGTLTEQRNFQLRDIDAVVAVLTDH